MPTIGEFHTFYWEFSDTNAQPVHIGLGGYPAWQASVVMPSLFGAIGAWCEVRWAQLQWFWRFCRRVHALRPVQRDVLVEVVNLLESPLYPHARTAVGQTAKTLGFASPEAWKPYSRLLKADPGRAENVFRHERACELTKTQSGSTCTHATANLLVELAYHEYARRPW